MAATYEVGTPLWWVAKLEKKLDERLPTISRYNDYYCGRHDLRFASEKFRQQFGRMFLNSADNWMPLVVDSVQERLRVDGFRLGEDTSGDKRAWKIWQDNNLDAESDVLHTEALINGEAYTLVWYDPDNTASPLITIEHPSQVVVEYSPENRRVRRAALKRWIDDDGGTEFATLYLPGEIYKFQSTRKVSKISGTATHDTTRWVERESATEAWPLRNPFARVPIVPIVNRRRMLSGGESEIAGVITEQDKVNKLTFDMMVAAEYTAFRQRWATGIEVPTDPETHQPLEPFKSAVDRLWTSESKDTSFGEFEATDLRNYVEAIEQRVQHIATQSRTPPHYFFLRGNMPSGESLRSAETGLVAKAKARQLSYGEGWEETMRLALFIAGAKPRGGTGSMATQWGDAETRTESQHIDAVLKKLSLGVPLQQLWRDAGYSEQQITGFRSMLSDEEIYRSLLNGARGTALPENEPEPINS